MTAAVTPMPLAMSDDLYRQLWRERTYPDVFPDSKRCTCDEHNDWRAECAHLHKEAA